MSGTGTTRRRSRLVRGLAVGAMLVLLRPGAPGAQEVTGAALRAAFLFNFVKFTTWPAEALPDNAPLVMCVVNAPAIGAALTEAVEGRLVAGHELRVAQPTASKGLGHCHVLYVSGPRQGVLAALAAVRHLPVLTVSDLQGFTTEGGIAQLHVQQGQLRFVFALDAVRAAQLQISSRLLALSREP